MTLIASGIVAVPRFGELTFHKEKFGYQGFACKILTPLICRSFDRMSGLKPTRIQAFQGFPGFCFFWGEHILL